MFPAYPAVLLTGAMLCAYSVAFLQVNQLALVYSCALAATGLGVRCLRRSGLGWGNNGPRLPRHVLAICAGSIALSTLLFGLAGLVELHSMTRLTLPFYDQEAYLKGALDVRDAGGALGSLAGCFLGDFPATRRDPLFLLVIAPFAHGGQSLFEAGKHISLLCGTLAVASAGFVGWRLFSPVVGVTTAFCLSMNHYLLKHSALVNCEPLYVLLSVWAVYCIVAGATRRPLWVAGGVLAGLANLCKGSGILIAAAFGLAVLWTLRWRALRDKHVYLFVLAFVLTCSPFMVNATVQHGNPLHNPNGQLMWADTWQDASRLTPAELERSTLWQYMRRRTPTEAWLRLSQGLQTVAGYFVTTAQLRLLLLKYAEAGPILVLACLALLFDPQRFRRAFFLALVPLFFLLIGWLHPIGTSERHILPLVPFVFAYFGQFLSQAASAGELTPAIAARRAGLAHAVAGAVGVVFMLAVKGHRIFTTT